MSASAYLIKLFFASLVSFEAYLICSFLNDSSHVNANIFLIKRRRKHGRLFYAHKNSVSVSF
jgi:hypothetical protein